MNIRDALKTETATTLRLEAEAQAGIERDEAEWLWEGTPRKLGTPFSQLSGRPGQPGHEEFCRIARSWGHD